MAEEEPTEKQEESGGDGRKKIIVIGVTVLVVVIAAVAVFFLLSGGEEEEGEQVDEEIVEDTEPLELPVFLELGTFAVMLKDGKHNFRVGLQLMMSNELAKFYLNSRMPLVKDLLNETLPAFDAKQLKSEEGRDKMRADVIEKLLLLFPKEIPGEDPRPVRKLLFEEFVVTPLF